MFQSFHLRERFRFRRLDNRPLFHFIMIIHNISNPYRNLALYWNTAIICFVPRGGKVNQLRKMASSFFV